MLVVNEFYYCRFHREIHQFEYYVRNSLLYRVKDISGNSFNVNGRKTRYIRLNDKKLNKALKTEFSELIKKILIDEYIKTI